MCGLSSGKQYKRISTIYLRSYWKGSENGRVVTIGITHCIHQILLFLKPKPFHQRMENVHQLHFFNVRVYCCKYLKATPRHPKTMCLYLYTSYFTLVYLLFILHLDCSLTQKLIPISLFCICLKIDDNTVKVFIYNTRYSIFFHDGGLDQRPFINGRSTIDNFVV